jgi:dTDP-3-amino-3,4,6-trideoxy-alpha-D-glucose transaminase
VSGLTVPLFDTPEQVAEVRAGIERRLAAVIDSGRFILGPEVEAFEGELASYLGVAHVVGVGNGTDALTIALRALGVGAGDDVVVPSFTFYATAEAVANVGARPVFCDVDPDTFCISAETVERALTAATRAVIPVHLFGTPAPMGELRALASARGLKLLEDAAQAAGARERGERVGGLGDAATFSFFPSKNLFCLGDGGAITTNDADVASRARLLRLHGSTDKQTYLAVGYNSRLDAIQAGVLREVLPRLDAWNAARRELAGAYEQAGLGELVALPKVPPEAEPVHHMYVVRSSRRERLIEDLRRRGIDSRPCYPVPVHRQPAMEPYARGVELPATDLLASDSFALPMGPMRDTELAVNVVDALHQSVNSP